VVVGGGIYTSKDSGNTWTSNNVPKHNWTSVASSVDGNKLVAVFAFEAGGIPGPIFTSTNSGNTWTSNYFGAVALWHSVASSADGSKLVAVNWSSIFTSTNSGDTWTSNNAPQTLWSSVASSADGSILVVVADGGGIWVSQTAPAPLLNLTTANTNLALSWIIPSTNFVLQQCSDLTAADWSVVTNVPMLNLTNLQNQVILSPPNGNDFYRLATP
jgi:hypothetical protein